MPLRDYQNGIVSATSQACAKHKRVIMQAPPGAGKTYISYEIIKRHLKKGMFNRVLVSTHRQELFEQTAKYFDQPATLQAGDKIKPIHGTAPVLMTMIETLKRRDFAKLGKFTLAVFDEAHRADFNKILDTLPADTYVIGATATPLSSSKKHPLKDKYNSIVSEVSIPELISDGYLASPIHHKAEFDDTGLRTRGGEFTSETQIEKIQFSNIVDMWKQEAAGKKTLVFNVNKKHTIEVDRKFKEAGISSTYLLSGDADRTAKLDAFRTGDITILNNCEIATTGFDVPGIECVIVNRATQSLPLWLQMLGRGSRIAPGKDSFIILDLGGNIDRHGMWHLQRDWKDIFNNPPKPGENPAPMKSCPECDAILYGGARECQFCGYTFPSPAEQERQDVIGYLQKVGHDDVIGKSVDQLSVDELIALERSGKYKPSYIWRILRTRGREDLQKYAEIKDYKNGWVYRQMKMGTGFKNYRVTV